MKLRSCEPSFYRVLVSCDPNFWGETETLGIKGVRFQGGPTLLTSTQDSKYSLTYCSKEIQPFWIWTNSMNYPGAY